MLIGQELLQIPTFKEHKSDVFLFYLSGSGCFSGSQWIWNIAMTLEFPQLHIWSKNAKEK